MDDYEVNIIKMPARRMALVNSLSNSPEHESYQKLMTWAKEKGLVGSQSHFRWFGRDNPPPVKGKTEYGYDAMITIPENVIPEGDIRLFRIPECNCAVVRTELKNITVMWNYLYNWVKNSRYEIADHGLEELLNPFAHVDDLLFDLWLPIKE